MGAYKKMKKILIPNGSFHDIPLIKEAKKQGYYVITSGTASEGLGHKYADKYINADFSDPEEMLRIAQEKRNPHIKFVTDTKGNAVIDFR